MIMMFKSYFTMLSVFALAFTACEKSDSSTLLSTSGSEVGVHAEISQFAAFAATTRYLPALNGADETSAFQSLVNQSVSGDEIVIMAGNHYFTGTVHVNKSGLTIRGEHSGSSHLSFLRKASATPGAGVSVIDVDADAVNNVFDWIYIDGGMLPEPNMRVFGNGTKIYNSHFRNSGHSGILIHQAHGLWLEGVKAYYNYVVGISQWASSDNYINNSQVYENGGEGITIDGGSHNCFVENVWVFKNNKYGRGVGGIGIDQANGANIFNCMIDQTYGHAVRFQNNLNQPDDGCQIYNNTISNSQGCAISIRKPGLVTNLGVWGNTVSGNSGTICYEP